MHSIDLLRPRSAPAAAGPTHHATRAPWRRGARLAVLSGLALGLALAVVTRAAGSEVPRRAVWSEWPTAGSGMLEDVPLTGEITVDLKLERFRVTTPASRFVLGGRGGDRPLDFDPESVVLLRGTVAGEPGSRAFLALSEHGGFGAVELDGDQTWLSTSGGGRLEIVPGTAGGWPSGVPLCGVGDEVSPRLSGRERSVTGLEPIRGLRQIELAIETDYEFFQLFGELDAAGAYVVSVYAAASEIFLRDTAARLDLTFVRLWDDPDDLFNEPSPLSAFRDYWEINMGAVHRDVAQFFSGRRNLPYGGVAYVGSLCGSSAYSVAGYAIGYIGDPYAPDVFNRDITVTAHEIGHNSGAPHTHAIGVDDCDDENSSPQRGTIMSYCGQTFTGGAANTDLRFHTAIQEIIDNFADSVACVVADCDQNGVDDALDIAGGSPDVNMNGVPDVCEDCNGNGTLDDADIAGGSPDVDGNGVPDECQLDCNGNQVPDGLDVAGGASLDLYGDGVPDECDADCDANLDSDYNQIQVDMSLDVNRNAVLDACEDCDGDGTPDLEALDHAHNLWLTSLDHSTAREYLADVGPLASVSGDAGIAEGQDLLISADRRMLISSRLDHRVIELTVAGAVVGDLVTAGAGGLSEPAGLVVDGDTLLVASRGTDQVLAYDLATGAPLGPRVAAGAGGLVAPFGLALRPAGAGAGGLLVTSDDGRVLEYDAGGAFAGELVSAADNGGLLEPRGLLLLPSERLLVASHGTDQVLEYDSASGAFVRQFNQGGTADRLTLDQPWTLRLGPDGGVYVSRAHDHAPRRPAPLHLTNARVYHFDPDSGFLMRAYVLGVNSGVEHPTGFDFVPGDATDCNRNLLPDVCDLKQGGEQDANGNGIPDSCESLIFSDGFETGDTLAWSSTTSP